VAGGLDRYRGKRRFAKTPEPEPAEPAPSPRRRGRGGEALRFVIQEHSATSWHFDLRLERDGVAVSFALPRGLPLDPKGNRKAVHTEDHPLEYLEFAGTIPRGNYGAGEMSVWDHGTYEAEKWRPRELIVSLHGSRVSARFALFQAGDDDRDWIIHRMDAPDPADPFPEHVAPMLATPSRLPADRDGAYAFEVKWDGMRAIAFSEPGRLRLESRSARDVTAGFPELHRLQRRLGARRAVLDGEVVALAGDGRPSFQLLQARIHLTGRSQVARAAQRQPAVYMIFDLLYLDDRSTTELPYAERREMLEELGLEGPAWRVPPALEGRPEDVLEASRRIGLEGIIAKRIASPYRPGQRGRDWLKIKNVLRQEFVIGGYTTGAGRRSDSLGALLVGYHGDGGLRYAGKVGTGFTDEGLDMLLRRLSPLVQPASPFERGSPPRGAVFVRPELVCECSFSEWTAQGLLRQPAFLGLRDDKPAAEVVREEPAG
jgi:bifunctional non-homologous end joining protein LigD